MRNRTKVLRKLIALYKRIPPAPPCAKHCTKCCGPVFMAKVEAEMLGVGECVTPHDPDTLKCAFIKDGKCSVYDKRPLTCRIFNTTTGEHPLACFHTENGTLSTGEVEAIYEEYFREVVAGNPEDALAMMQAMDRYADAGYEHDLRNGWLHHDPRTGEPVANYAGGDHG